VRGEVSAYASHPDLDAMTINAVCIKHLAERNGTGKAFGAEDAVTRGSIDGFCEPLTHFAVSGGRS
jgi:hypothetical protein